jgi:molybdate-binding protein/DNA-binding transcriptional regulator YhcF (GntR family)
MEEKPLYLQIIESIRDEIISGALKAGDPLPSVRQMTTRWKCTTGTVQRAYQELAHQRLINSRPGIGTRVTSSLPPESETPLRRAALIHRAEAFLIEALNSGHNVGEIEQAVRVALDRWKVVQVFSSPAPEKTLRFEGSHDLAIAWIASHFGEIVPGWTLQLNFKGSLGGLMSLAEGKADIAGCHLWDDSSSTYNLPYIRTLFPNRRMAKITLAYRRLGLILPHGNPLGLKSLADLPKPEVNFINRQIGSGTRVWLDSQFEKMGIDPKKIKGYGSVRSTHTEVAQSIAGGTANAGIGLEGSAMHYGLDFIFLTQEPYDLVTTATMFNQPEIQMLWEWLKIKEDQKILSDLGGYRVEDTGKIQWVGGMENDNPKF